MKLGAALVTATLGATGIACDGDTNAVICGGIPADFLSEGDFEDTYWACDVEEVGGDEDWSLYFYVLEDGTLSMERPGTMSWEFDEDACAAVFAVSYDGDDYEYILTNIEVDGDGGSLTMDLSYSGPDGEGDYTADCERHEFSEGP